MARTAFSQKFQNTCLILSPSASAQASRASSWLSMTMPVFSAVMRWRIKVSVSSSKGMRSAFSKRYCLPRE